MKRQHRIAILQYTTGNFWLLLLPLVRGLISSRFDFYHWIKGAYLDIIVILLILGLAFLRWYFIRFEAKEKEIYVIKGALFKKEITLPYHAVSCMSCCNSLLLRPFRAVKIFLNSDSYCMSKKNSKADIALIISETDYLQLFKRFPSTSMGMKVSYKASKKNLVIFSLLFSSALSGVVFIGTFFIQGSKLVGKHLEENFFAAVSNAAESVKFIAEGATPFSIALTMIIGGGWLLSFIINLFRHICFGIARCGGRITVESGYFSRWKYYVNYSRINYADLRQNLLMKVGKIMSVYISCTGYRRGENEMHVFIPVTTRRRVISTMEMMLPDFTQSNISLKTKRTYIMAYIWLPLVLVVGVPIAAATVQNIFPEWRSAVRFLGVMFEIPLVYLLAVKIVAQVSTGIGDNQETLTIQYCKAYKFHTIIVPKGRVAYIKIRRTLFQRASGCCDVIVYTRGEHVQGHRVRGVMFTDAEEFVKNCDKMC